MSMARDSSGTAIKGREPDIHLSGESCGSFGRRHVHVSEEAWTS